MNGVKRKNAPASAEKGLKKQKVSATKPAKSSKPVKKAPARVQEEDEDSFEDLSEGDEEVENDLEDESMGDDSDPAPKQSSKPAQTNGAAANPKFDNNNNNNNSAESHAKQRALAKERKAAKPNADAIERSKKLWERLRRKSHVPLEERKALVAELFDLINGRVRDFVFKHDSVRVIQCALKYANVEQRRSIVQELKGDIRTLAESRYGKFLVGKMVTEKEDKAVRDAVIPEFYGHVRRLINHPEASWIMDDIYRQIASRQQKAMMLREWYGAEFALFHKKPSGAMPSAIAATEDDTADLSKILEKNPEKRKPILQYLLQMINGLVQKKMTGFTMLHDAMLQYFLALPVGGEEHKEFLEILKGDIDGDTEGGGGDLFKNLAFTKSGSRLVCLAIAYGTAKDRKIILRVFRDTVEMLAVDPHGKMVLVAALDVPDDTKMSGKAILPELLGQTIEDEDQRLNRLAQLVTDLNARLPILLPIAGASKSLFSDTEKALLQEIHEIRKTTSKKDPEARRQALLEQMSGSVLELVAKRADVLVQSGHGSMFMMETLLEVSGPHKEEAKKAVAQLAAGDPTAETPAPPATEDEAEEAVIPRGHIAKDPVAGRMIKTLVDGGKFDKETKSIKVMDPSPGFGAALYPVVKSHLVKWACSDSSFVALSLMTSADVPEDVKKDAAKVLKKGRKQIEKAAVEGGKKSEPAAGADGDGKPKKKRKVEKKGNAGAKVVLEKLG